MTWNYFPKTVWTGSYMISHGNSELADEMQGFGIYDGRKFRRLNQFLVNHHEKVKEVVE